MFANPPILKSPEKLEPRDNIVVNPLEREEDTVMAWSSVDGAQSYELTIAYRAPNAPNVRAPASDRVILKKVMKERAYTLKTTQEGVYTWSVRPMDSIGRPGESTVPKKIIMKLGKTLDAPEVMSKEVQ